MHSAKDVMPTLMNSSFSSMQSDVQTIISTAKNFVVQDDDAESQDPMVAFLGRMTRSLEAKQLLAEEVGGPPDAIIDEAYEDDDIDENDNEDDSGSEDEPGADDFSDKPDADDTSDSSATDDVSGGEDQTDEEYNADTYEKDDEDEHDPEPLAREESGKLSIPSSMPSLTSVQTPSVCQHDPVQAIFQGVDHQALDQWAETFRREIADKQAAMTAGAIAAMESNEYDEASEVLAALQAERLAEQSKNAPQVRRRVVRKKKVVRRKIVKREAPLPAPADEPESLPEFMKPKAKEEAPVNPKRKSLVAGIASASKTSKPPPMHKKKDKYKESKSPLRSLSEKMMKLAFFGKKRRNSPASVLNLSNRGEERYFPPTEEGEDEDADESLLLT
jgi:hypothetical protein